VVETVEMVEIVMMAEQVILMVEVEVEQVVIYM
jgi:hypothetical protein